jgi:hypothetical protein
MINDLTSLVSCLLQVVADRLGHFAPGHRNFTAELHACHAEGSWVPLFLLEHILLDCRLAPDVLRVAPLEKLGVLQDVVS